MSTVWFGFMTTATYIRRAQRHVNIGPTFLFLMYCLLIVFYVIIKISILPWYTCFLQTVSTFFKRSAVYRSSRHRENLQSSNLVKYFCLWSLIFWLFVLPSYNTNTNTETNTIVSSWPQPHTYVEPRGTWTLDLPFSTSPTFFQNDTKPSKWLRYFKIAKPRV
jgi:hypothetical protein